MLILAGSSSVLIITVCVLVFESAFAFQFSIGSSSLPHRSFSTGECRSYCRKEIGFTKASQESCTPLRLAENSDIDDGVAEQDILSLNSKLKALSQKGGRKAAEEAQSILYQAEENYQNYKKRIESNDDEGGIIPVIPDTISYTTVADAWAKSRERGAVKQVELILQRMQDLYESGKNIEARPNTITYNTLINAWAKSGERTAAARAEELLAEMDKDENSRPDT
eukprot:CAMPEP_0195514572 /NCGR_PEP_ID=MMETSP0794_2-20130614/5911_1 /TAXON_ID=515487 /ORGANISM="Stephanopyxis turris, Strain CCMP 815" /LENGTH=223 /DNA_ID=CAMNT_0040642831 /DNA_START=124 /DNA_END=791 /DNA_ORIENTATION=+